MRWLADGGHAWLEIELEALIASRVAHKISGYSYIRNGHVYLEEDCDATTYLATLKRKPKEIMKKFYEGNCPVRRYRSYPSELFNQEGGLK